MAGDWKTLRVSELQRDGVLFVEDGNHGEYRPLADEFEEDGTPFVRPDNLIGGRVHFANCDRINDRALSRVRKGKGRAGDIVFTHRATVGRIARVGSDAPDFVANPGVTVWRSTAPDVLDPVYLYFFMQTPTFMNQVWAEAGNTDTFPYVSLTQQRGLEITFPGIEQQRQVAHILGTLDDKIELNRRMSETLEAMARALFKSWFVDFDPVRAKMAGRDSGLPKPFADLFPSRLVDSELGEIPEGWEVRLLGELLELAYGKALKAEDRRDGTVPVFGSNGQVGWHDERLAIGPGIVVGRKGNPGVVTWASTDFFVIDTAFYVVTKELCSSRHFLFHALRSQDLALLGADSAVPGLNRNLAYMSPQILPPRPIVNRFEELARSYTKRVRQLIEESRTLAALRDVLLPKLVSGEMRLRTSVV